MILPKQKDLSLFMVGRDVLYFWHFFYLGELKRNWIFLLPGTAETDKHSQKFFPSFRKKRGSVKKVDGRLLRG